MAPRNWQYGSKITSWTTEITIGNWWSFKFEILKCLMYHPYSHLLIATFSYSRVNKIQLITSFLLKNSSSFNLRQGSVKPPLLLARVWAILSSSHPYPATQIFFAPSRPTEPWSGYVRIIENRTFGQFVGKLAAKWICRSGQFFHHGFRHLVSLFP